MARRRPRPRIEIPDVPPERLEACARGLVRRMIHEALAEMGLVLPRETPHHRPHK